MPLKCAHVYVCENVETKKKTNSKHTHNANDAYKIGAKCLAICVKINFDAILFDDL